MANRTLGEIIQGIKKDKALNGKQFVALLGIGASTLVDYEKDKKKPGWDNLCSLRRIGVSIDAMIDEAEQLNVVSEPVTAYQGKGKYPADLQHIINEWPELCDAQKAAVIGVLDAFSKQDTNSLKASGNMD